MNASARPRRVPITLGPVARTLLVPLWARAAETRRPDGVLRDPKAAEILDAIDFDFTALRGARASQLGCCVRAALVDAWVRDFLARHPTGTVIELGVGLNSRRERLDNGLAHWVELDLPEVTALRERFFAPAARRALVAGSITDAGTLDALRAHADRPCLVVSEGVLVYLDEPEVRAVFARLQAALPGAALAFDAMTPAVLRFQGGHDAMRHFDARFTWSVADPRDVEAFAPGIALERSHSFYDLLYAHPKRLPLWMRASGPVVSLAWPAVRHCYTINLARFGAGR
jgi:O-methyltransferase involved in polyketide biosynthesis